MLFSRYKYAREEATVNLIPVMNLFVTLIPFLLLAAAFYHVGVVPASLPSQTDGTSDIAANTKSVTVNLIIEEQQIRMSANNAVLPQEQLDELALNMVKKGGKFDLPLLTRALEEIKRRYPESDTVIVLPGDLVKYQDVVQILDAAREIENENPTGIDDERKPLFPVVVLSRKV